MNCPHCGAEDKYEGCGSTRTFRCGSTFYEDKPCSTSVECRDRQISALKAELAASVRRDDPRLIGSLGGLERAVRCSMSALAFETIQKQMEKLQSIISGQ